VNILLLLVLMISIYDMAKLLVRHWIEFFELTNRIIKCLDHQSLFPIWISLTQRMCNHVFFVTGFPSNMDASMENGNKFLVS